MKKIIRLAICLLFLPMFAYAHGVGEVYALPIPLKYYLGSAGLAVALSFFIFAYFLSSEKKEIPHEKIFRIPALKFLVRGLRFIGLLLLALTVLTGIFGAANANNNFAPIFFWVYFLLGFGILSIFIGNIWDKLNPWKYLSDIVGWQKSDKTISPLVGVVLVFVLYWFELASGNSFVPIAVGGSLLIYTIFNLLFSYQFKNWFKDGEVFSVFFGLIGKLAFFRISDDNQSIIYSPLVQRLSGQIWDWSKLALASILLAGTSFDSFRETIIWYKMLTFLGLGSSVLVDTIALVLFPIPFLALYLVVIWLMQKITQVSDWQTLSKQFIYALIPIAFGYTLAHNFSLVIVTVPKIISLLSDPFGFGWNIFNTTKYSATSLILGAKVIWFIEIGFVVAAHIAGTFFAHILAVRIMPNLKKVLVSQYPTLILMVIFTVTTLWLLAQPLVVSK